MAKKKGFLDVDTLWRIERNSGRAQPERPTARRRWPPSRGIRWTTTARASSLWLLSTLGGQPRPLTRCGTKDGQPRWSPRGDLIAFTAKREQEGTRTTRRSST
jgi:Tol biopolymer transport system component